MKPARVVEAVLLDLDGTLLDHRAAARVAFSGACRHWVPAAAVGEALEFWRSLEKVHMQRYLAGELSFAEQRRARMRDFLTAYGAAVDHLDEKFAIYLGEYERAWRPFEDVAEVVPKLGRAAVLSNGDRAQQRAKMVRLELDSRMPLLVPADVGAAKPAAASFLGACGRLGWDPTRVLYVGDDLATDAEAAAAAGLVGCWLDRDGSEEAARPEVTVIHSLRELPALIS
ncbi:HAD family hydrolase [Kineosporia sp. NBRC 101677]|uniref:HAD family hydrolase n=1 Tax=Kineosporia sp. NBRC 101677 TaxID=3032197 RepID=UPI00249FD05A|nr:HAD family hydrolase [Kineosporia sp. NBRC 101677]GLY17067.1 HAD family hydrolase [Kineosporia sp. NBRC 101677]